MMDPLDELPAIFQREFVRLKCVAFPEACRDDLLLRLGDVGAHDEVVGVIRERAEFPEWQREFRRFSWSSTAKEGVPSVIRNFWSQ